MQLANEAYDTVNLMASEMIPSKWLNSKIRLTDEQVKQLEDHSLPVTSEEHEAEKKRQLYKIPTNAQII